MLCYDLYLHFNITQLLFPEEMNLNLVRWFSGIGPVSYLFVIDKHGSAEGVCNPVNQFGGLLWGHVHQHTFRNKERWQSSWKEHEDVKENNDKQGGVSSCVFPIVLLQGKIQHQYVLPTPGTVLWYIAVPL